MLNLALFDIMFIAETKIDNSCADIFHHPNYRVIRRDRKKGGGGLMAFIREDLSVYRRNKLEPESLEAICLDVSDRINSRFIVCACYRSQRLCKPTDFISSLTAAVEMMYRSRQEVMVIGDCNMDMMVDGSRSQNSLFKDFCERFCSYNQIRKPTRVTEKTKKLIDVVLASHPERFASCRNLQLGLSDNDLVYAIRKSKTPRPKAREFVYRSVKNFKESEFLADLVRVPWDSAYVFGDVNDLWDHWGTLYRQVLDAHAPVKKKRVRGEQLPWITPELQREISYRNHLFNVHAKSPSASSWEALRKQRNKVT